MENCSNRASLPEVAGDAAIFVTELDHVSDCVKELTQKMRAILIDENLRKELIHKGLKQSKKFSWERTAEETLEVYYEVYKKKGK